MTRSPLITLSLLLPVLLSHATLAQPFTPTLEIPVRVHLLRTSADVAVSTTLTSDLARCAVAGASNVWGQAGIRLAVERVLEEPPATSPPSPTSGISAGSPPPRTSPASLVPAASFEPACLNVYFLHRLEPNGVLVPFHRMPALFVKDTARLHAVPGGISEPLPRVLAHELGHTLGLSHREELLNLMASGTTGTVLSSAEIATARANAATLVWIRKIWPSPGR